jgi:hypothetical protein
MTHPDDELKPFLQAYPDTSHVDVLIIDLPSSMLLWRRYTRVNTPGICSVLSSPG